MRSTTHPTSRKSLLCRAEVTMKPANKMPKAIRISRKLKLSSEKLVVMAEDHPSVVPTKCTRKLTGCGPVHTC
ncbi:MAG TPA: hypothetical protein VFD36_08035 [Kofleriaceae bacterium]|nr:hypothetical protein [Kofleriaceae bacterium]